MEEICRDFLLDWERDKLYNSENDRDFDAVAGFVMALEMGYETPAVDVFKRGKLYYICEEPKGGCLFQYRGSCRSIAHYIIDRPLKCNLWDSDNSEMFDMDRFYEIKDLSLSLVKSISYSWYDLLSKEDAKKIAEELGDELREDKNGVMWKR